MDRPEMTNWNLGASEVQATHQRNIGSDEIRIGGLPQHLIILFTKPPREMNVRCEGVKRNAPPPVGSIALVPVGAVADVSWRGNKDCLQVSVEPNLVQRVAAKSFERDLSSAAIPPLDAFIAPELRSAMLATRPQVSEYDIGEQVLLAPWFVDNVHTYSTLNQIFRPIQRFPQSLKSVRIIAFAFSLDGGVSEAVDRGAQTFDRFVSNPEGFR